MRLNQSLCGMVTGAGKKGPVDWTFFLYLPPINTSMLSVGLGTETAQYYLQDVLE